MRDFYGYIYTFMRNFLFCFQVSVAVPQNGNYFLLKGKVFPFSPIITLMQGKPAGNHHGAERDGGDKNQDRKALVVLQ
jgi:hypothetical protein